MLTTYTYDPVGNRTRRTRAGTTVTEAFDRADRLATGTDLVDANGNVTGRGPTTLGYDAADRLTSMSSAPYVATYAYDGDGVRVARDTIGAPETNHFRYVHDRGGALPTVLYEAAETANGPSTTAVRKYVWGAAGLAYVVEGSGSGTPAVMHADGLGSVRALTDAVGSVTQVYRTDAFGVLAALPESSNPPTQPFRFAGEQWDYEKATAGLVFLRARSYDPDLGRFLQRDPLAGAVGSPQSLNRYAYALNNPVNLTDPGGLRPLKSAILDDVYTSCVDLFSRRFCFWWQPVPGPGGSLQLMPVPIRDINPFGPGEEIAGGGSATGKVYRGLAAGEDVSTGIRARAPEAVNDVVSHVAGKRQSQWISTTKDLQVALEKYGQHGVVEIDVAKVGSEVVDISEGIPGVRGMLSNWARKDREVLIQGYIPPEAITAIR